MRKIIKTVGTGMSERIVESWQAETDDEKNPESEAAQANSSRAVAQWDKYFEQLKASPLGPVAPLVDALKKRHADRRAKLGLEAGPHEDDTGKTRDKYRWPLRGNEPHPFYREREGEGWYLGEIERLASAITSDIPFVNRVHMAIDLGAMLEQHRVVFTWNDHALRGQKILNAAKAGGGMRNPAKSVRHQQMRDKFTKMLSEGKPPAIAIAALEKDQDFLKADGRRLSKRQIQRIVKKVRHLPA